MMSEKREGNLKMIKLIFSISGFMVIIFFIIVIFFYEACPFVGRILFASLLFFYIASVIEIDILENKQEEQRNQRYELHHYHILKHNKIINILKDISGKYIKFLEEPNSCLDPDFNDVICKLADFIEKLENTEIVEEYSIISRTEEV